MPPRTCLVTLTDSRGIRHSVEVVAESLYEAAVLGLGILRKDDWFQDGIGAATRIEVAVREPATIHAVTLQQIERWLSGATISPVERMKRGDLTEDSRSGADAVWRRTIGEGRVIEFG